MNFNSTSVTNKILEIDKSFYLNKHRKKNTHLNDSSRNEKLQMALKFIENKKCLTSLSEKEKYELKIH